MVEKIMNRLSRFFNFLSFKILDKEQRSITRIYVLALSSIALMAIFFQIFKFSGHMEQLNTVNRVRVLERHGIEGERIYNKILDAQITTNKKNFQDKVESLRKNLLDFNQKHNDMLKIITAYDCKAGTCKTVLKENYFAEINNTYLSDNTATKFSLEKLLAEIKDYQSFIIKLNKYYETKIKRTTHQLIFLDLLFLVLLIIVLVFQAFLGFKPAVQKLNEALAVRSDFISRISHEIRNPMNSIMGMTDILSTTRLTSEQRQYVDHLQRSSQVLLEMLNNLVDFSGVETKIIELKPTNFNLYKLVDKVTDVISVQAHDKGLEVFIDIDPNIPQNLRGDLLRLEQVLLNLFNNALKFTNRGYILLKISLIQQTSETATLDFSLKDTGIGIAQDKLNSIFNSFVQEDSSIKRRFGGSGLGLTICREIIQLMGSKIEVKSEKNVGSIFTFKVSLEKDEKSTAIPPSKDQDNPILFVANTKDIQPLIDLLNNSFEHYKVCKTPEETTAYLKLNPQVKDIIVDDSIGIVNMINTINHIPKEQGEKRIYALLRTNFPKENMELIRKNGFQNFLIKPFRKWHIGKSARSIIHWSEGSHETKDFIKLGQKIKEKQIKILAVDDANDNLFLIKELLSPVTNDIDFASNGLEAWEKINTNTYDLIFMDIQMPVMDGYTAIKKIRSAHKHVPIFAVTAHAGLVEEKRCLEAGFNGRITKPINRSKIFQTIQTVLNVDLNNSKKKVNPMEDEIIQKLLPTYFEARNEDLQLIRKALEEEDYQTVKRLGHRVKGSAKSYGFEDIGELGHKLEHAAASGDKDSCIQYLERISQILISAKENYNNEFSI